MNPKKELLWSLWVGTFYVEFRPHVWVFCRELNA